MKKKKIGIIVQRYGQQVNGGAEVHARMIAEKLAEKYDVTILTSRALDYHTWKPELPRGESYENGIRIIRFDHTAKPTPKQVHKKNRQIRGRLLYQKFYRFLGKPKWYLHFYPNSELKLSDEEKWLEFQGPAMYTLLDYLKKKEKDYSAFIFFTYLYYPTAMGIRVVGHKALLIPTMHDEPAAYFPVFRKVMAAPLRILFNTISEMKFSEKLFPIEHVSKKIAAVGIDPPPTDTKPLEPNEFGINGPFILYVGRIDKAKGCEELLDNFDALSQNTGLTLVLAGKNMITAKKNPKIIYAGFISDTDKWRLMKAAQALVIPSKYESLSLVLLESFACRTPVIANKECEVLKDHIEESNGGWLYTDKNSFSAVLREVEEGKGLEEKGIAGYNYVTSKYTWEKVMHVFDDAIEYVEEKNRTVPAST